MIDRVTQDRSAVCGIQVLTRINKKHLKNVGPIRYCEPFYIVIHQGSLLPPLSHAACASISTTTTTTTTTTTRDRRDRYGPMEWAQSHPTCQYNTGRRGEHSVSYSLLRPSIGALERSYKSNESQVNLQGRSVSSSLPLVLSDSTVF